MKLFEYEAKILCREYNIEVPDGKLAFHPHEARSIAEELGAPVVVKAQVLVREKGKKGGVKFAHSAEEAENHAKALLGQQIGGETVRSVLVERKIPKVKELYFGMTLDRIKRSYVLIASPYGGAELEQIVEKHPEAVVKEFIPHHEVYPYHTRRIARKLGYSGEEAKKLQEVLFKHCKLAMGYDTLMAEMNPLFETPQGAFIAVEARIILDGNAIFDHSKIQEFVRDRETQLYPQEVQAQKNGLAYVRLRGDGQKPSNIGVIGNGAGLVMATMDAIREFGGEPANFLDIGGGASPDKMFTALDIVLSDPRVKVVFVNVLGGITRCDEVAEGIVKGFNVVKPAKPLVVRLVGTNEEKGKRMLMNAGIDVIDNMKMGAKRAFEIAKAARE